MDQMTMNTNSKIRINHNSGHSSSQLWSDAPSSGTDSGLESSRGPPDHGAMKTLIEFVHAQRLHFKSFVDKDTPGESVVARTSSHERHGGGQNVLHVLLTADRQVLADDRQSSNTNHFTLGPREHL